LKGWAVEQVSGRGIVRGGLVERYKNEGKTGSLLLLFKMKITMTSANKSNNT